MNVQNKYLVESLRPVQTQPIKQKTVEKAEQQEFDKLLKENLAKQNPVRTQHPVQTQNPVSFTSPAQTGKLFSSAGMPAIRTLEETNGEEVRYSKHALMRLEDRNITLTQAQKEGMAKALDKAESKGLRDSLVLLDNLAFVVNVKSRTVITAASSDDLKGNVFTNIDGAVIMSSES